jgi:hypothetical protein
LSDAQARILQPRSAAAIKTIGIELKSRFTMADRNKKSFFRAFLDFFTLFSGVSTASGLARTQGSRPRTHGIFLFRQR